MLLYKPTEESALAYPRLATFSFMENPILYKAKCPRSDTRPFVHKVSDPMPALQNHRSAPRLRVIASINRTGAGVLGVSENAENGSDGNFAGILCSLITIVYDDSSAQESTCGLEHAKI